MKQINTYISEKLVINKNSTEEKENNPIKELIEKYKIDQTNKNPDDFNVELLDFIVQTFELNKFGNAYIWDDTKNYNPYDDFIDEIGYDCITELKRELTHKMVAMWHKTPNQRHEIIDFLKDQSKEKIIIKNSEGCIKTWDEYKYNRDCYIYLYEISDNINTTICIAILKP